MEHYLVVKKVALQAGSRTFRKDNIITVEDVGQGNIARYLKKGYIRPLEDFAAFTKAEATTPNDNIPFYLTAEGFITPEQVNKLVKQQLVEYAGHIGFAGYKPNISAADLKKLIIAFIAEASENDDGDDDEDEDDGEDENGGENDKDKQADNK